MSDFDPETFMHQTVDKPLETDYTLVPEAEYQAFIDDFTHEAFEEFEFEYKRGPNAGQPGSMQKFNCPFVLADEGVKTLMGRDKVTVIKPLTLNLKDGGLDWGKNKNVELGKIREAVGQNVANQTWQIAQLRGAGPVMVKVIHRSGKRKDGSPFKVAEIDRVVRIAR